MLIGQSIGLQYLMPLALQMLERDPLTEGDLYAGDLLSAAVSVQSAFLDMHPDYAARLVAVAKNVLPRLRSDDHLTQTLRTFLDRWTR